jgi:hypothetical protein
MPHPAEELLTKAKEKFGDLSKSEALVVREAAGLAEDVPKEEANLSLARDGGPERVVRAGVLRWLLTDPGVVPFVEHRGIVVRNARIAEALLLNGAKLNFRLSMTHCLIPAGLTLTDATTKTILLSGSECGPINGVRLRVEGSLVLADGFRTTGTIRLIRATITGDLECDGARIEPPPARADAVAERFAMILDRIEVKGFVSLRDGFRADGQVKMIAGVVEGELDCNGGTFSNTGGIALNLSQSRIGANLRLDNGFRAEGEVRGLGLTVGGNLDCERGGFANVGKTALNLDQSKIGRSVFLRHGFSSQGEVRGLGLTVGGDIDGEGGKFSNPGGMALRLNQSKVGTRLRLRRGFAAEGEVQAQGLTVDGDLDGDGGKFSNPKGVALNLTQIKIGRSLYLQDGFEAEGAVLALGLTVEGNLESERGRISNPGRVALDLGGSKIGHGLLLRKGFVVEGELRGVGLAVGGDFDCAGGKFSNPGAIALNLDQSHVGARILLRNGFRAEGEVRFQGATVGGEVDCAGGSFLNPQKPALNFNQSKIGGRLLLRGEFESRGLISVVAASIGGILDAEGGQLHNPEGLALDLSYSKVGVSVALTNGFSAEGEVRCRGITVEGDFDCRAGRFANPDRVSLDLERGQVKGTAFFGTEEQDVDPFRTTGLINLTGTRVGGDAIFAKAVFEGQRSGMEGPFLSVGSTLHWADVSLPADKKLVLNLFHTKMGRLIDDVEDADSWPTADVVLDGMKYDTLGQLPTQKRREWLERRKKWLRSQPKEEFSYQPYEQLADVLRRLGLEQEAKEILIEKQRVMYDLSLQGVWPKAMNWILWATLGYGYRPFRVLYFALFFVVLGTFIFYGAFEAGFMGTTRPAENPIYCCFMFSLDTFLPIINFRQKDYFLLNDLSFWGQATLVYYWVHVAFGWLLTSLAVAGFTGLVRRL